MIRNSPRVSFAMSCHGYGRYLKRSLDSILEQRDCALEIIVVDDGSTDETADVLRGYSDDERLRVVRHETRLGHLRSNNEGLALARGEFVGIFDADDFLLRRNAVARKVEIFDDHPSVGFVYSAFVLVDEEDRLFRTFQPWERDYVRPGIDEFRHLVRTNYVPHSSTLVRRAFHARLDEVYDVSLPYAGDWDIWLRLCARHDVGYIADALQAYRQHRSQMSVSTISARAATDELLRTIDRAFAELEPDTARSLAELRREALTAALLHQTRTDRSLGRIRRSWTGLIGACRRSPRLLSSAQFYSAFARLLVLTALGYERYGRLVAARDHIQGGKGPVA